MNPCLGPLPDTLLNHPLVREAWDGLDPAEVWDTHVHFFDLADGASGAAPSPLATAQRRIFLNGACLDADEHSTSAYVNRLLTLVAPFPAGAKLVLLAMDAYHDESGAPVPARTHFLVPNDLVAAAARAHPDRFEWTASVHPYRQDAVAEVKRVRSLGARAVKWIPAAQGIDPASALCDPFYEALARLGLPLLSHAGTERAAPGDDTLGNPLRLRRALEHGVRVVVAHGATMGEGQDLDAGPDGSRMDNFALFERMMNEPAWVGRLFGDLSAVPQAARAGEALRRIVERGAPGGEWEWRLLNGSDFPIPGIMPLYSLRQLVALDLLDAKAVGPLSAIRRHNSLLFDFVLKRHLQVGARRLSVQAFETRPFLTRAAGGAAA